MTTTQPEFDQLYHDYYPRIAAYLSLMLGNHEDAEDLAQETFLNVARVLPGLVPDHTAAWISRIATNAVRDALGQRAIARLSMSHLDFETATMHLATDENPETLYVTREQFWQAWRRLPRQYRAAAIRRGPAFLLGGGIRLWHPLCTGTTTHTRDHLVWSAEPRCQFLPSFR